MRPFPIEWIEQQQHFHRFSAPISQESCELAGKAIFSGWIFNTVTRSGQIWIRNVRGGLGNLNRAISGVSA
jgi:hypothetical protein